MQMSVRQSVRLSANHAYLYVWFTLNIFSQALIMHELCKQVDSKDILLYFFTQHLSRCIQKHPLSYNNIQARGKMPQKILTPFFWDTMYTYGYQKRGRPMTFKSIYYVTTNQT